MWNLGIRFDDLSQEDGGISALGQEKAESEALLVGTETDGGEKKTSGAAIALHAVAPPLLRRDRAALQYLGLQRGGICQGLAHFVAKKGSGKGDLSLVETLLIRWRIFHSEHAAGIRLFDQVPDQDAIKEFSFDAQGQVLVEELRLISRREELVQPFGPGPFLFPCQDRQPLLGVVAVCAKTLFAEEIGKPTLIHGFDDAPHPVHSIWGDGIENSDGESVAEEMAGSEFLVVGDRPMHLGVNALVEIRDLVGLHARQGEDLGGAGVLVLESGIADASGRDAQCRGDSLHDILCCLARTGDRDEEMVAVATGIVQGNFFHDKVIGLDLNFTTGPWQIGRDEGQIRKRHG